MKRTALVALIFTLSLLVTHSSGAVEGSGPRNPSFETGSSSPDGWQPADPTGKGLRTVWLEGSARSGGRSLMAESAKAKAAWTCETFPIDPAQRLIVDGWIKTASGTGWLEVVYLSADGPVQTYKTPRVPAHQDWTYVALETPSSPKTQRRKIEKAQVVFWVRGGEATLDDVGVHPASPKVMVNSDFEMPLDKKNRIPMWSEETTDDLISGQRAGSFALDSSGPFDGKSSLAVTATGEWFSVSSIHYARLAWTDRIELRAVARCEPGAQAQLVALWTDDAQKIVEKTEGPLFEAASWQPISSGPLAAPEGATALRAALIVRKKPGSAQATARFDGVDLCSLSPLKPAVRVVVDQVGYESGGPKSAVVMTNFFPAKTPYGKFELTSEDGRRVLRSKLTCGGRMYGEKEADWGWYFWRADFSTHTTEGKYSVRGKIAKVAGTSHTFQIEKDLLFRETAKSNVDFFFVQRCGCDVPGWHAPCHLDDAKLKDGTHKDLIGGWHSAGDYNKLVWEYGDGGVMYALVNAAEAVPSLFAGDRRTADKAALPDILDEALWGAKFMAKIQVPETGGLYNHIEQGPDRKTWMNWCPPEKTTDNIVGTADDPIVTEGPGNSPLAIGAWARLAKDLDARGIQNDYVARAIRLWEHATVNGTSVPNPLLLIASVDLYLVTKDEKYLEYCRRNAEALLATGKADGPLPGGYGDSGDIPAAALAHFALRLPGEPLVPQIKTRLQQHLPGFIAEARNPLGLMRQKPGSDGHFFEPTSSLGCNFQICCRAWSALMVYRVTGDRRAWEYAANQLDFVLGKNPYDICMFEGKGTVNPPRYHHRYITIPGHERGAVPGAIPNGFVRDVGGHDRPGFDMSKGGRLYPSYRTSEPWLVHNVFYTLAITALHEAQQ